MTASIFRKFVLPPVLISASIFAALTLPLAVLGSKPVVIQLQEEPVFSGKLRDVAAPYLGLASVLSLGAGVASIAVTGWQQSSQKSAQVEQQLSGLQQRLQEKEELLKELKFSESRLETFGLDSFLEAQTLKAVAVDTATSTRQEVSKPITINTSVEVVEPLVITTQKPQSAEFATSPVQAATSRFSSTQTYLAYTQASAQKKATFTESAIAITDSEAPQVAELQSQLQQIMAQMETLHNTLQTKSQLPSEEISSNSPMFVVHS